MQRRSFLYAALTAAAAPFAAARFALAQDTLVTVTLTDPIQPLNKPHAEWKAVLPADRYRVLFEEATERPGSSPLDKLYADGSYLCAACLLPLFDSSHKFDSGTGWPSFYTHIEGRIGTKRDFKLIWPRTEYHCIRCGGHQGHVFDDGPKPTGQRWCNNGLALEFVPRDQPLPALRS